MPTQLEANWPQLCKISSSLYSIQWKLLREQEGVIKTQVTTTLGSQKKSKYIWRLTRLCHGGHSAPRTAVRIPRGISSEEDDPHSCRSVSTTNKKVKPGYVPSNPVALASLRSTVVTCRHRPIEDPSRRLRVTLNVHV